MDTSMGTVARRAIALVAALGAGAWLGCSSDGEVVVKERTAVDRGRVLAGDPALSASRDNAFACTTCHAESPLAGAAARILPGAVLAGTTRRPTFWGGRITVVGDAVDECLVRFMQAPPLDRTSDRAKEVYAYLASLDAATDAAAAQPFTVVRIAQDFPRGDAGRGAGLWSRTCAQCHGDIHTGARRLKSVSGAALAAVLPEDTVVAHEVYGPVGVRQAVVEKVRHGSFLGVEGVMPPFSREVLSDGDLADVVTYLGLY